MILSSASKHACSPSKHARSGVGAIPSSSARRGAESKRAELGLAWSGGTESVVFDADEPFKFAKEFRLLMFPDLRPAVLEI